MKQKRKRNTVRRLGTVVGNGSKSRQIHQTPGAKLTVIPSKSLLFRMLKKPLTIITKRSILDVAAVLDPPLTAVIC